MSDVILKNPQQLALMRTAGQLLTRPLVCGVCGSIGAYQIKNGCFPATDRSMNSRIGVTP